MSASILNFLATLSMPNESKAERVIIDVTRLVERFLHKKIPTGVDRIGLSYIKYFRGGASALIRFGGRWVILSPSISQQLFNALLIPGCYSTFTVRCWIGFHYILNWKNRSNGALLLNVLHSGLEKSSYANQVIRRSLIPFYFLHDLIPITHPEYCRPFEAEKHKVRLDTILSTGKAIAVNSKQTEHELISYAQSQGQSLPPVFSILLTPTILPEGTERPYLDKPYFVVICTIEPRKNHLLLLNIWREFVQEYGDNAPRLILIGKRGWECEQVEDMLDRCSQLKEVVIEKSQCGDLELANWMAHARALLFPSFAEGFGMPIVEALSAGVPVIASDLPVFQEIAGNIPDYINPLDAVTWKNLILDYTASDSLSRAAQAIRLKSYTALSEENYFAQAKDFISSLGEYR